MARVKKSRKIGRIGVPKEQREPKKVRESQAGKPKKRKGNPSGSRHSNIQTSNGTSTQQSPKDPRVGSKKPIPLVAEAKTTKPKPTAAKPKYFSPAQELKALEENQRLADLLDTLDDGKKLSKEDQQFVDTSLARHKVLCDLLGISENDEVDQSEPDDPLSRFEAIDINKLN